MNCLKHAIGQSLDTAYAHHIQRLMVTGNFALLAQVHPDQVDAWYLGIYIDALEWVEITNTRGMSQYADGGLLSTKPYISSANYIRNMSDYCQGCPYDPRRATGEGACPFNALYWNFLEEKRPWLSGNPRMGMMYRLLDRKDPAEREGIRKRAAAILDRPDAF
jgi:deoxyribodipyrimidine photolyase-related protein